MKQSTVAIIGMGTVGSTTAYTLLLRNLVSKLIVIDIQELKCKGHACDLTDALSFSNTAEVVVGSLADARQADIVIITCGMPQKPGQSRIDLLQTNYKVIKELIHDMKSFNPEQILIMVTNPVDVLTNLAVQTTGLPKKQIFGSGTFLDTQRLRYALSEKMAISERSIHAYVLGEHGETQFVAWSSAQIAGIPLIDFPQLNKNQLADVAQTAKRKAYDIIEYKGATAFGVAACVAAYCENIIFDTKRVLPLSCYIDQFKLCLSMPAVLGRQGIEQVLMPPLNQEEKLQLQKSVDFLKRSSNFDL